MKLYVPPTMKKVILFDRVLSLLIVFAYVCTQAFARGRFEDANSLLPCNAPPVVPVRRSLQAEYELRSVQILTRHGARTSVFALPGNGTKGDIKWTCDTFHHYDRVEGSRRSYRRAYVDGVETLRGNCAQGQLTSRGSEMHKNLGKAYREKYAVALNLTRVDDIYLRSTDVPRVFASLESNLEAIFPNSDESTPTIYTVDNANDPLASPNQICALGREISEKRANDSEVQEYLAARRHDLLHALAKFNLSTFDMWKTVAIPDQIVARKCSMDDSPILPLPNGATYEDARLLYDVAAWISYHELNTTRMRRLSAGLLLREMKNHIDSIIRGDSHVRRMVFFSAHDTTVYPLVNAFGAWSDTEPWPPFASHVELELWKKHAASSERSEFAVALSYNGRSVRIFDCPEICPLERFDAIMRDLIPTSRAAYLEECGVRSTGVVDEHARRRRLLNP